MARKNSGLVTELFLNNLSGKAVVVQYNGEVMVLPSDGAFANDLCKLESICPHCKKKFTFVEGGKILDSRLAGFADHVVESTMLSGVDEKGKPKHAPQVSIVSKAR